MGSRGRDSTSLQSTGSRTHESRQHARSNRQVHGPDRSRHTLDLGRKSDLPIKGLYPIKGLHRHLRSTASLVGAVGCDMAPLLTLKALDRGPFASMLRSGGLLLLVKARGKRADRFLGLALAASLSAPPTLLSEGTSGVPHCLLRLRGQFLHLLH
jgi:hypothetical protein